MRLIYAEKPSMGREIAAALGVKERFGEQGFLRGNGYIVAWAAGHLIGIQEPDEMRSEWSRWNAASLPMIPSTWATKLNLPMDKSRGFWG